MAHHENASCIEACVKCAEECEHCGDMCIGENRPACARACIDCAASCWTAASFMSRGSKQMSAVCGVCRPLRRLR